MLRVLLNPFLTYIMKHHRYLKKFNTISNEYNNECSQKYNIFLDTNSDTETVMHL